nr:MAG TPA: hypothetical protein [Inoviridae sp.]
MEAMIIAEIGTSIVLIQLIRYLPMPECLCPLTSRGN